MGHATLGRAYTFRFRLCLPHPGVSLSVGRSDAFLAICTQIGTRFLVDATLEEEQCMGVRVIVGISPKGIHAVDRFVCSQVALV